MILKVLTFRPFRYPTSDLYKEFPVLTVRQLYIKVIVTRQHSYNIRTGISARRPYHVYNVPVCNTSFSQAFFNFLGPFLYNLINKEVTLNNKSKYGCGRTLDEYLLKLDYDGTENMFIIPK